MTATSATAAGSCAREGCTIASGVVCARDFPDPFDCEDFEPYESEGAAADNSDAADDVLAAARPLDSRGRRPWLQAKETAPLHSGRALTPQEATQVRRARVTAVVVPIGEVSIGKTTLLAAIFEHFCLGGADEWSFAGSQSLMGFEERSHLAMAASGRVKADTPRTSTNTDEILLHLALVDPAGVRQDVLFADVSGEHAEGLRVHNDPGDYARVLRAATCVLVMLDGKHLASPNKRHSELARARTLFNAMHQNNLLSKGVPALLVVTKWDLCTDAKDEIAPLLENLLNRIRAKGVDSDVLRLSARPDANKSARGSDSLGALLNRVMMMPVKPRTQQSGSTGSTQASHAFEAGSAVMIKYLPAAK